MIRMQLRTCSTSPPTQDHAVDAVAVPRVGELLEHGGVTWAVVDVHWFPAYGLIDEAAAGAIASELRPMVICHSLDRPRARQVRRRRG